MYSELRRQEEYSPFGNGSSNLSSVASLVDPFLVEMPLRDRDFDDLEIAVLEGSVGKSVSEGEEGGDVFGLEPSGSEENKKGLASHHRRRVAKREDETNR